MLTSSESSLLPSDLHGGFNDQELIYLSDLHFKHEMGFAPWFSWEVENSSFGKTFRHMTGYPNRLPIFACSDHGVHWESRCWPNELNSSASLFLTWNKKKSLKMSKHGKHAVHVPHPWVRYRQDKFPTPDENRYGTVVFYPHSNDTTSPQFSVSDYIDSLLSLPVKYHPLVICLSFHDIRKGLHLQLRKYQIPLITAGCTNSQYFVDRFYTISNSFKYSTSSVLGSHSFYLAEASNIFFIHGSYPSYMIKGSISSPDGPQDLRNYGDEEDIDNWRRLVEVLRGPYDIMPRASVDMMNELLGLNSAITDTELLSLFWTSIDSSYFSSEAWLHQINQR